MAAGAAARLALDRLLWLPAADPPHKPAPDTPYRHRLELARLASAPLGPAHAVSDLEARLPSPSYSIQSIAALKAAGPPDAAWYFLIGSDSWDLFPTWHRWRDILAAVTVAVYPRAGHGLPAAGPGVLPLDLPLVEYSSTAIRARLRQGENPERAGLLPELAAYCRTHHLYGL